MYDGSSDAAASIGGKLCGRDVPDPIQGTGNEVVVKFHSDYSVTASGFEIRVDARKDLNTCVYCYVL